MESGTSRTRPKPNRINHLENLNHLNRPHRSASGEARRPAGWSPFRNGEQRNPIESTTCRTKPRKPPREAAKKAGVHHEMDSTETQSNQPLVEQNPGNPPARQRRRQGRVRRSADSTETQSNQPLGESESSESTPPKRKRGGQPTPKTPEAHLQARIAKACKSLTTEQLHIVLTLIATVV